MDVALRRELLRKRGLSEDEIDEIFGPASTLELGQQKPPSLPTQKLPMDTQGGEGTLSLSPARPAMPALPMDSSPGEGVLQFGAPRAQSAPPSPMALGGGEAPGTLQFDPAKSQLPTRLTREDLVRLAEGMTTGNPKPPQPAVTGTPRPAPAAPNPLLEKLKALGPPGAPPLAIGGGPQESSGALPFGAPVAPSSMPPQRGTQAPPMPVREPEPEIGPLILGGGQAPAAGTLALSGRAQAPPMESASTPPPRALAPMPEEPVKPREDWYNIKPLERPEAKPRLKPAPTKGMAPIPEMLMVQDQPAERLDRPSSEKSSFRPYPKGEVWAGQPGKEPWQVSADEEEFQEKRDRVSNLRGIAESLGNFDRYGPLTGAQIRVGQGPPRPFVAEDLRSREAELADKVSPQEAQFYKTQGYNIPVGMSRKAALTSVPALTRYQYGNRNEYRDRSLELRERELDIAEQNLGLRGDSNKRLREQMMRLPVAVRKDFIGYEKALGELDVIQRKVKTAKFGPVQGRVQMFSRYLGLADPDTIATGAALINAINQAIYQATGKQLNAEEMKRITQTMPAYWDSPETFDAVLQEVRERLERQKEVELGGYRRSYDTSEFENLPESQNAGGTEVQPTNQPAAPKDRWEGGWARFQDGEKTYTIRAVYAEDFMRDRPNAKRLPDAE